MSGRQSAITAFIVGECKVQERRHLARPQESLCSEAELELRTCPAGVGAPDLPCLCSAASDVKAEHNGGVGAVRKKITMH